MKNLQKIMLAVLLIGRHGDVAGSDSSYKHTIFKTAVIGLPIFNAIEFWQLSEIQKNLKKDMSTIYDRYDRDIYSSQDVLQLIQLHMQKKALKSFKGLHAQVRFEEFMGRFMGLSARFMLMCGSAATNDFFIDSINGATSLRTTWNLLSTRLNYNQAKKEAEKLTVDNLEDFLVEKNCLVSVVYALCKNYEESNIFCNKKKIEKF